MTISIKAMMINKDFLYKMPGQEKEMSSIPYYSHFDCNSQDTCSADLRLEKQKDTTIWACAFSSLLSRNEEKRSEIVLK